MRATSPVLPFTLHVLRQVLLEARLLLGALLVVLLFGVATWLSVERQEIELALHAERAAEARADSDLEALTVLRPPHPLSFVSAGGEHLPRTLRIRPEGLEIPDRADSGARLEDAGARLDWVYLITVCLSLLALVLSYDLPTGEREAGTLRLILAHPVRRSSYLLGSILGRILALLVPLVLGFGVSLVVAQLSPAFELGISELLGIGFLFGLAVLYLSGFVFFGVWVSTLCRNASTALVWLALFWVVTVVLLPANGAVLAGFFEPPPLHQEEVLEIEQLQRNYEAPMPNHQERIRRVIDGGSEPATIRHNLELLRDELVAGQKRQIEERDRRIASVREEYLRRRERRLALARWLTLASPAVLFRETTERLLTSGLSDHRRFLEEARRYQQTLRAAFEEARDRHRDDAIPAISWESRYRGFTVTGVAEWSYDGIPPDRDLFPEHRHTRPVLSGLARAGWGGLALGGLAAACLFAALGRFRRYDAR